ncbi:DUF4231 domain-containing protein [Streptomyces globisporus]|uniref:DUF4231 domain-containing protein n=1 Tax=Streptomyces globisporus TaxID=1908 RepID=UPI0037A69C9E
MARSLDDDAPRRMSDADEQIRADQQQAEADDQNSLNGLRRNVKRMERSLARRRRRLRVVRIALVVAGLALMTGLGWTVLAWGSPSSFLRVDIICGTMLLAGGAVAVVAAPHRGSLKLAELEDMVESNRDVLRFFSSRNHSTLEERRGLYREDVAGVIEQHRNDSRRYRLVHNALQNLIMIGSAATTTVAALDTRNQFTWQNITIVAIGFTVTLAAAFTGYYKYRERSYFLLQTADAIEEEANAFTLGIGPYSDLEEGEALKLFTQRVEDRRNEQRRRQQQLDQPADQASPSSPPPAA